MKILAQAFVILIFTSTIFSFTYIPQVATGQETDQKLNITPVVETNSTVPWIGISYRNVTQSIANVLEMDEPVGIIVTEVTEGGPAWNAGLLEGNESAVIGGSEIKLGGDIIIKADNESITAAHQFGEIVREKAIGDNLTVTVLREGQIRAINVTISSQPTLVYESSSTYTDPENVEFVSYESFDLEFGIRYPSEWERIEMEGDDTIIFQTNFENFSDFREEISVSVLSGFRNETLQDVIAFYEELYFNESLTVIESSNIELSGNPAIVWKYNFFDELLGGMTGMKVITIANDKAYDITYVAQDSEFNDYLPTIESILSSFDFWAIKRYENFGFGMRMEYPSNWNIEENEDLSIAISKYGDNLTLYENLEDDSTSLKKWLQVFISNSSDDVHVVTEDFNNMIHYHETLDKIAFRLIESVPLHRGNIIPAHIIRYSYADPDVGKIIESHIITMQNNRLFTFSFSSGQEEYLIHDQILNNLINSIEFYTVIFDPDPNLGLLLQYPSDRFAIVHRDNTSIAFRYLHDLDILTDDPNFMITVSNNQGSSSEISNAYLESTLGPPLPANKKAFTYKDDEKIINTFQVTTKFNGKVYNFTYTAEPDEYAQSISTIEKFVYSTKIISPFSQVDFESARFDSIYGFGITYNSRYWSAPKEHNTEFIEFTPKTHHNVSLTIRVSPYDGRDMYDFVGSEIHYLAQQNSYFNLLRSNSFSHKGHHAYDIEYVTGESVVMTKFIVNERNNIICAISYTANFDEFYSFLPLAEQVISSLEFRSISNPLTHTGFKVGDRPNGIAVNPTTKTIYVANSGNNTVSVIDVANNEIIDQIVLSQEPIAIAANPSSNTIYVTHSDSISVIDGGNNAVVDNIPVDMRLPLAVAVNPSTDIVYVADGSSKDVSMIDGKTNEVVDSISTGNSQNIGGNSITGVGVAVDPLRDRIYVANPSTSNITVIDGISNRILSNISAFHQGIIPINPYSIAVNSYTNIAYVVGPQYFATIDLSKEHVMPRIYNVTGVYFNDVSINPFTNIAYVNDVILNIIYVIDPRYNQPINNITLDTYPIDLEVDPSANIIYVANMYSDTVSKINGTTNNVIYGVRFDINDRPIEYDIFGIEKGIINASKSVTIYCNGRSISDDDYIQYDDGTRVQCLVYPKSPYFPLISSSWSGFDDDPSDGFMVNQYGTMSGTFVGLDIALQVIARGPILSIVVLISVVLAASIPSFSPKLRKLFVSIKEETLSTFPLNPDNRKEETTILSRDGIIAVDATIIIGVLIFISFSDGFEANEQTQITVITATTVFPFAISAIIASRYSDKLAVRLMIAGFINLMIAVILIAILRL